MPVNGFVGDTVRLDGGTHADAGTLLIVLRNGRPVRVVPPGGRIWRGFRAPAVGTLDVVPVHTGTINVEQVVREVATKGDGYLAQAVPLSLRVRLAKDHNYGHLQRFMRDRGESFAEDLLAELRNGIERLVRDVFATQSHQELYGSAVATALKPTAAPLSVAGGLMQVEALTLTSPVSWSPVFLSVRESRDQKTMELERQETERVLGVSRKRIEAEIETVKYQEYGRLAEQLGVNVTFLLDPDLLAANQAKAMEALTLLLEPANRSLLQRDPNMLPSLLAATGIAQLPDAMRLQSSGTSSVIAGEVQASPPPPLLAALAGGQHDEMDLTRDGRIVKILSLGGIAASHVIGAVGKGNGETATVLLATSGQPPALRSDTQDQLARLLNVQHATALVLPTTSYAVLVDSWLSQVVAADGVSTTCVIDTKDGLESLTIILGGPPRVTRDIASQLSRVGRTELPALEALLPFASVSLQIG